MAAPPKKKNKKADLLTPAWDDEQSATRHAFRADGSLVAFKELGALGTVSLVSKEGARVLAKLSRAVVSIDGPCVVAGVELEDDDDANIVRATFRFQNQKDDLMPLVDEGDRIEWLAIHPAGDAAVACVQALVRPTRSKLRLLRKGGQARTLTIDSADGTRGIFDGQGRLRVVTDRAFVAYDVEGKKLREWPAKLSPGLTTLALGGPYVVAFDRLDNAAHVYGADGEEVMIWKDADSVSAALTWDGRHLLVVTGGSVDLVDVAKQKRVARMKKYSFSNTIAIGPNDELAVPAPYTQVYQLNRPG